MTPALRFALPMILVYASGVSLQQAPPLLLRAGTIVICHGFLRYECSP